MQAKLFNSKGEEAGTVELKAEVFGLKPRPAFLHEAVTIALANRRRGTANAKTRAEVSGGGKKPWKQKHTGRARHGSTRSPIWRHGGVTFGPRTGVVRLALPRQKARLALAQALSARLAAGDLRFVDALSFEEAKTRRAAELLKALECAGRTLLVVDKTDAALTRAFANLPGTQILLPGDLDAYRVLSARKLVITRAALESLGARWN